MTAIRVIFDGKAFVPQQPVSLPPQSEALVIVEQGDRSAHEQLDAAIRAYYEGERGAEDWGRATSPRGGKVGRVNFAEDPKSRPAFIVSPDVRNELANSILA